MRPERPGARLARIAVPALTVAAALAPLVHHWLAGRTLVWFDSQRQYATERWIVDEALRSFRLPLWNPFLGGGMPLLAGAIHGALHPVSILTAWLGTSRSEDVLIGTYVACAALGAALLARDLGASRTAALFAGVTWGASGFVLSTAAFPNLAAGAGSLPFCVAGLRRYAVEARPGNLAYGAIGAAALALSGDFQALVVGGALAFALAWEAAGWRGATRAVGAGLLGLAIAGVQLVPSLAHLPRTSRGLAEARTASLVWALEPWRIPELVLPGLLWGADPLMDLVYGGLASEGAWPRGNLPFALLASVFVGLVPLVLAGAGALDRRRGRVLAVAAPAFLWIALGPALGAAHALGGIPVWGSFRYSEKMVGPLTLVLALLGALGLDAVVERRVRGARLFAGALVVAALAVACCHLSAARLSPEVAQEAAARILRGTWHVAASVAALGGWLLLRDRLGGGAPGALALVAWAATMAASPAAMRAGDPAARLRAPGPVLQAPPPGPRILTPYTYEPLELPPGGDWIDEEAKMGAANAVPAYNVRFRLDSLTPYEPMGPRRLLGLEDTFGVRWSAVARRYGVTHVIVDPPRSEAHRALYQIATAGGVPVPGGAAGEIWAVPHREWAYFAEDVRAVSGEEEAVAATALSFATQSAEVVVEGRGFRSGPGQVLSVARGLEALRIEAEADAEGTLVVADAWWPGWEATIDGVAATVFRADALVRAVRWPAGRHVLEMRYRPPEATSGVAASLLGIVALALGMVLLRRAASTASTSTSAAPSEERASPVRSSGGS